MITDDESESTILFIILYSMEPYTEPAPQPSLADELEIVNYVNASLGQRFVNYLIDNLLMTYGLSYLTGIIVARFLYSIAPDFAYSVFTDDGEFGKLFLASYMIGIFNYVVYYTFCEKVFKGYTLGKLITGTRAIREDGMELTFRNALLRSLSRLVPFEPLSAFGVRPWHDSWTGTRVIKSR